MPKSDAFAGLEAEVKCINTYCGKTRWVSFADRHAGNKNLPKGVERQAYSHCVPCAGYGNASLSSGFTTWTGRTRQQGGG